MVHTLEIESRMASFCRKHWHAKVSYISNIHSKKTLSKAYFLPQKCIIFICWSVHNLFLPKNTYLKTWKLRSRIINDSLNFEAITQARLKVIQVIRCFRFFEIILKLLGYPLADSFNLICYFLTCSYYWIKFCHSIRAKMTSVSH